MFHKTCIKLKITLHNTRAQIGHMGSPAFPLSFFTHRSSRLQIFFILDVLKDFTNVTGKHLCWSFFLIKWLQHGVFLWHLQNFKNTFFYRTPPVGASFTQDLSAVLNVAGAYLEPSQTSKMKHFVKIVYGFQLLTIFAKSTILVLLECILSLLHFPEYPQR